MGMMNDFMAQINLAGGFARQNRYQVIIPTAKLKDASAQIYRANNAKLEFANLEATDWVDEYYDSDIAAESKQLTVFCEQSQLPSYQFQMETNRHYGPAFKVPHMPEYQDITMTFLCGNLMTERYFFDTWMYLVMDPETNNFNYIDEYSLNIDIIQLSDVDDGTGEGMYNYWTTLVEAYPIAINTQELAYEANNTIQKMQVTFTYKYAIPFDGKGSTTGRTIRSNNGKQLQFSNTVSLTPIPKDQSGSPDKT